MMSDRWEPAAFKTRIDEVLHRFVAQEADRFAEIDPLLTPVAEQLEAAVADGKRLRAAFCYWGWRAVGQPDSDALVRAAASMELVHAAAVVHDDLIDDSPLRHGRPTAHRAAWCRAAPPTRRRHREVAGDASRGPAHGNGRGVVRHQRSPRRIPRPGSPPVVGDGPRADRGRVPGAPAHRSRSGHHRVAEGDPLQDRQVHRRATPADRRRPGRGRARLREGYCAYGLPLGEAFQLRDDLLGLFGDPERTGKANADDVRGHRPTALLAETWRLAGDGDRERLRALLGRRRPDADALEAVREVMCRLKAPDRIEDMISARVHEALGALHELAVPAHAASALTALAQSAADRRS